MDNWTRIGTIAVDSGTVMLADPCYHLGSDAICKPLTDDWMALCKASYSPGSHQLGTTHGTGLGSIVQLWGDGMGLMFDTMYGDGEYPVEVLLEGNRVAAMRIDFTDGGWWASDDDVDEPCDCGCEDDQSDCVV